LIPPAVDDFSQSKSYLNRKIPHTNKVVGCRVANTVEDVAMSRIQFSGKEYLPHEKCVGSNPTGER
jgi:hypothetical protein